MVGLNFCRQVHGISSLRNIRVTAPRIEEVRGKAFAAWRLAVNVLGERGRLDADDEAASPETQAVETALFPLAALAE